MFEKCEIATKSIELSTTYNFNSDAQSFIEQKIKDKKEIACGDDEVNELVSNHQIETEFHIYFVKNFSTDFYDDTFLYVTDDTCPSGTSYTPS